MKGEVSISNWYLGDPKQNQLALLGTYAEHTLFLIRPLPIHTSLIFLPMLARDVIYIRIDKTLTTKR